MAARRPIVRAGGSNKQLPAGDTLAGVEPEIAAGTTDQYLRGDKTWQNFAAAVRSTILTGLSTASSAVVVATDSVLVAIGKLQAQITGLGTSKLDATANAVSASKLATARAINGVNFDGTANIIVADNTKLPTSGGTISAVKGAISGAGAQGQLEIINGSNSASAAGITFHRGNSFAANFGIDTDNKLKIGGFSMGTGTAYEIFHDGNASGKSVGAAAKLATARTINGVSFDGTTNITVSDSNKLPLTGGRVTGNLTVDTGIDGGYGNGNGGSAAWGACIWGMGSSYDGVGANDTFAPTGMYGVAWVRGLHASHDPQVGEGTYVYQAGNFKGGIGSAGIKTLGVFYGNGSGLTTLNATNISSGVLSVDRLPQAGPTTPSFVNSFTDAGGTRYWKFSGQVYVAIDVNRATTPSNDTTMFTLPAGFRPAVQVYSPVSFGQASPLVVGAGRIYVTTGGAVTHSYAVGATPGSSTFNAQGIISFPEA